MYRMTAALLCVLCASAAAAAETYEVDKQHTHATFAFQHLGLSTFHGKIPASGGTIVLDRAGKSGKVDVTFDPGAVATGVPDFDQHLRSADFFEVEKHGTATFRSSEMTFEGDQPKSVKGELTIKGITRPVTLKVESFNCAEHPMMKVPACGANATATIKRSDYGMTYGIPMVPDEIELTIEVEAMRAQDEK